MAPRWIGPRGEAYVLAQVALLALIFLGPAQIAPGILEPWPAALGGLIRPLAWISGLWGGALGLLGLLSLGRNLTVFPRPKAGGSLVTTGVYSLIRHPLYSSVLGLSLACALARQGTLSLLGCILLFLLFDRKAAQEERWLVERFPDYPAYRARTKRLIPKLY